MEFTIENYIKQHNLVIENFNHQEVENAISLIKETIEKEKRIAGPELAIKASNDSRYKRFPN